MLRFMDCQFKNSSVLVNIAYKQGGTLEINVENSTFDNCGLVNEADDYFAPVRFVNNSAIGTVNVKLTNNTFKNTIGTNGDILLGDYRPNKENYTVTCVIETKAPVMVKSSNDAPVSTNSTTIVVFE